MTKLLQNKLYGVIGTPSDWLIASVPNYKDIEEKYGIHVLEIPLDEVINGFKELQNTPKENALNFDSDEINKANKVYVVLENIVKKYKLDGFTIRCFDLLNSIHTTGCLALAKFNAEGIVATCEGDVMAMLSMAIAKEVSSQSSFQANPSRIDVENNEVLFAHCTVPFDMLNDYSYMSHFESGIGVAVKGKLKENQTVTIFRISKDLKRVFISKGKIIQNTNFENLCRTQILVKLEKNVKELLTNPCGNHHIIFYGGYTEQLSNACKSFS